MENNYWKINVYHITWNAQWHFYLIQWLFLGNVCTISWLICDRCPLYTLLPFIAIQPTTQNILRMEWNNFNCTKFMCNSCFTGLYIFIKIFVRIPYELSLFLKNITLPIHTKTSKNIVALNMLLLYRTILWQINIKLLSCPCIFKWH